jgi:hypothetical protein
MHGVVTVMAGPQRLHTQRSPSPFLSQLLRGKPTVVVRLGIGKVPRLTKLCAQQGGESWGK